MDTDNLRRLAEQATTPNWYSEDDLGTALDEHDGPAFTDADVAYIAAANPQAILALLDAFEESGTHEVALVDRVAALEEGLRALVAALETNTRVALAVANGAPVEESVYTPAVFQSLIDKARALLAATPSQRGDR